MDVAALCFVHFKGETGLLACHLNGEYTGANRDVTASLHQLYANIDPQDYQGIQWILKDNWSHMIDTDMPCKHKIRIMYQGNQKSVLGNARIVKETMKKEDHCSHFFLCRHILQIFSFHLSYTPSNEF
jgi:hypothetical protein